MKFATLYDATTGVIACTTSIQLPLGVDADSATAEQWAAAIADLEQAAGMPCVLGEPKPNQRVHAGVFVDVVPELPSLEDAKLAKWELLKAERDRRETLGFTYMGKLLQSDERSVLRINTRAQAARDALGAGDEYQTYWKATDNSLLLLDAQQMADMPRALSDYANGLHVLAEGLRQQLLSPATSTLEMVAAVQWPPTNPQ
jgi:hypothetical protein